MPLRTFALLSVMLLSAALFLRPALAANPLVTVELEEAGAVEAAQALSKAAGVNVALYTADLPPDVPRPKVPQLEERHTVSWRKVSFARALRQLCKVWNLQPSIRPGGGYILYPSGNAPAGPVKRVGLFNKNGFQLFVRSVSVNSNRTIQFENNGADWDHNNLQLQVGGEVPEGDGASIAGIDRVTAKDDRGNLLVSEQGNRFYGSGQGQYPDEWNGYISLSGPHPVAKKLLWVEGDVMRFKVYKEHQFDVPVPLPAAGFSKAIGKVELSVLTYEPQAGALAGPGPQDKPRQGAGTKVQTRVFTPTEAQGQDGGWGWGVAPLLVTKSGKLISATSSGGNGSGGPDGITQHINCEYPLVTEPVVGLRFSMVEKSQPEKLFSFRMENVPLPVAGNFVARRNRPELRPAPAAENSGEPRAFFEKGGARLTSKVLVGDQPAPDGSLSLGLSVKEGAEWGGVRWLETPVDKTGAAELLDVKPGTYRVLRVYRPAKPLTNAEAGAWENGELTITAAAGKEVALAPLRFTTQPAKPPVKKPVPAAPARKPAAAAR